MQRRLRICQVALDDAVEQGLFADEMVVERRVLGAHGRRDVLDRRGLEATCDEQLLRRIENGLQRI